MKPQSFSTGQEASAPSAADASAAEVLDTIPFVMNAIRSAMRNHGSYTREQLTVPQMRCLAFVSRQPGTSIGTVAKYLGVTLPTASAMVDRLARAGAVTVNTAADDKRRAELRLSDTGIAQMQRIRGDARVQIADALATCTTEELDALRAGLAVLKRKFRGS